MPTTKPWAIINLLGSTPSTAATSSSVQNSLKASRNPSTKVRTSPKYAKKFEQKSSIASRKALPNV
eukprot:CAMPEP_0180820378 /NCGR_PEP_ID=MMETSP1038_2-20121128/70246_1 /TAXON_ID=632150 /ORGANISM="Azadinium spinosum, Strain 3D9" /LENGTH=65 /DNA_ID=CAMNT_0022862451 /DNA_START=143 /DNA_END=340 /DNA_ORIENTATION=+